MFNILNHYSNPTAPSSYLGLGDALTFIGLVFTVYQLRTPSWALALRIRTCWQRNSILVFGGAGLLVILVKVLLFEICSTSETSDLSFIPPMYYELVAFLFFIASPLSLILYSQKKKLFTKKSYKTFYNEIIREISKGNNENVNAALEIFMANFKQICVATTHSNKELAHSAKYLLNIVLSDESIVEILTTKRLDQLFYIFEIVEKHNVGQNTFLIGIPKILQNLFLEPQSFFYKHLESRGLGVSSNIYTRLFGSKYLVKNFNLLADPTLGHSKVKDSGITGIRVFIVALSEALEIYRKNNDIPLQHIDSGLHYLRNLFESLCRKISTQEKRGMDTRYELKEDWESLGLIADFFGKLEGTNDSENITAEDVFQDVSMNTCIAQVLFKAIESLAFIDDSSNLYPIVLSLFNNLDCEDKRNVDYRPLFETQMWKKISDNVVNRHYPAALRIYLVYFGQFLAWNGNDTRVNAWMNDQVERLRKLLYTDLKPLLEKDALMVNQKKMEQELLPQSISYSDGHFTYVNDYEEIEIPSPKERHSALDVPSLAMSLNPIGDPI
jgi:hypothetical protein